MTPNLFQNNILLLIKNISVRNMRRNDIIVFQSPLQKELLLIKRIIAQPGDHIKIYNNNAILLNQKDKNESTELDNNSWVEYEWLLKEEEFIVLGDNLSESQDSRIFGPIKLDLIIGKAILKLKPLSRIK